MTQTASPEMVKSWMSLGATMRTGRKLGRTLYLVHPDDNEDWGSHLCVGIVDTPELAQEICDRWNVQEIR